MDHNEHEILRNEWEEADGIIAVDVFCETCGVEIAWEWRDPLETRKGVMP